MLCLQLLIIKLNFLSPSWFHAKVCIVAGVGFFTDAYVPHPLYMSPAYSNILYFSSYDIFAINIASTMLGYLYGHALPGPQLNSGQSLGIKVATPVGTFFGQLIFGWLADVVGRKRMCMYSPSSPYSSSYFAYRRCRAHDHHCCYFCPSSLRNC